MNNPGKTRMSPQDTNVAICDALGLPVYGLIAVDIRLRVRELPEVNAVYQYVAADEFIEVLNTKRIKFIR